MLQCRHAPPASRALDRENDPTSGGSEHMKCELCGAEATTHLTHKIMGNVIRTSLCDTCCNSPRATELIDSKCGRATPTAAYLEHQARSRLYVVMQAATPDRREHSDQAKPIAVFIGKSEASEYVAEMSESGVIGMEWYVVSVPLQDGRIT